MSSGVLERARTAFEDIASATYAERQLCLEDRRFYSISGAQWEGALALQWENKPRLEVNKVHLAVLRVINEYRANRITVQFIPKDGSATQGLSDTCNGLFRSDEQDSSADEAYDNAFEEAAGGGFGAFRLITVYEDAGDPENEKQRIRIEPIYDADKSVYFDLNAKKQDKSDARFAFIVSSVARSAYEDLYEDDPNSWPAEVMQAQFDWFTPDVVYVCEYYEVELKKYSQNIYKNALDMEKRVMASELEDDELLGKSLEIGGWRLERTRKIEKRKIHKWILSGGAILEDCGYIAGDQIPIVPVYGKRWFVDNVERCSGIVRTAKDAQRLKNMQLSKLAELASISSIEKPIMTPQEISGHQNMWENDNLVNYPYLLKNRAIDAMGSAIQTPLEYTRSPNLPPAMAALLQVTETDINDLLGNQGAGEIIAPNTSGLAVGLVQERLDMQAYIYITNFSKAMRRCGEIWLGMAKDVLVEENRILKIVSSSGSISSVFMASDAMDSNGSVYLANDLLTANFGVVVEVGPTSRSKRTSDIRMLSSMLQYTQDPDTAKILTASILMNMEGDGMQDINKYFRQQLVSLGVVTPTPEEEKKMQEEAQNQQPDPQAEFLKASAMQAQANAKKAEADSVLALAKVEEVGAKAQQIRTNTQETLQGMGESHHRLMMDTVGALDSSIAPKKEGSFGND